MLIKRHSAAVGIGSKGWLLFRPDSPEDGRINGRNMLSIEELSWVVSGSECVGVPFQCGYGSVVSLCSLKHY